MANRKVSPENFVKKWMEAYRQGHTAAWVSRELGVTYNNSSHRACRYRKRGINLPRLSKRHVLFTPKVINDLNELIEMEDHGGRR